MQVGQYMTYNAYVVKKIFIAVFVLAVAATGFGLLNKNRDTDQISNAQTAPATPPPASDPFEPQTAPEPAAERFDRTKHSTDDPLSIWTIINKTRPLPNGFKPEDLVVPNTRLRLARTAEQMQLRQEPAEYLAELIAAAKAAGYELALSSGYRSEALQKQFYDSYVVKDGVAGADTYSARPGFSEHQTGLAVDLGRVDQKCQLEICFGETAEGKWLEAHAHEYGFVVRYHKGKDAITGYQYEPWHLRYVGRELAAEMKDNGLTLEEFFGLPPAPDYL